MGLEKLAPAVVAIGCLILCLGCAPSPRHPPPFADFQRIGPGILPDDQKLTAQLAVFEAATFLPRDIERIQARGDAQELVGAALQVRVGDRSLEALTRQAWLRGSNDPAILTGLASSWIREFANAAPGAGSPPELDQVLGALERVEPENGLPLCLRAYIQVKQGDAQAARSAVQAARQRPTLRLHGPALRACVVRAALAAKYPRYTASMLAIGTPGVSVEMATLGNGLLNDPQVDSATGEACLELGRRLEAQATLFLEQLIAFNLQKQALELLQPPGFEQDLERMQNEKDRIKTATAFLDSATAHSASERQWLAYFEILFEKSESDAVNHLASVLEYKL